LLWQDYCGYKAIAVRHLQSLEILVLQVLEYASLLHHGTIFVAKGPREFGGACSICQKLALPSAVEVYTCYYGEWAGLRGGIEYFSQLVVRGARHPSVDVFAIPVSCCGMKVIFTARYKFFV
jgi:hypothetical protein